MRIYDLWIPVWGQKTLQINFIYTHHMDFQLTW